MMNLKADTATRAASTTEPSLTKPSATVADHVDGQQFTLYGITWDQYASLRDTLDQVPGLQMSYLDGILEMVMPSRQHESTKSVIGMLVEAYFFEMGIRFHALGSSTFRKEAKQRGLEPDECYCIGGDEKPVPDIAIEVVVTSGTIDKLEIYRGLEVPEVWFWQNGQFSLYQLQGDRYESVTQSQFLPGLDLALLATHVQPNDQFNAVMAFRAALR